MLVNSSFVSSNVIQFGKEVCLGYLLNMNETLGSHDTPEPLGAGGGVEKNSHLKISLISILSTSITH